MLPLDSKKWDELGGTYGATSAHRKIAEFVDFLDSNPAESEIQKRYREFEIEIYDELSHQQTTWTSAIAAVPHLLEIAKRVPDDCRCELWEALGIMHADSAGFIVEGEINDNQMPDVNQLTQWYDEAIARAKVDTVNFANQKVVSESSQFQLYCAIANFHDELHVYYAFRAAGCIEFECALCKTEFEGELEENGVDFVFANSKKLERKTYRMAPSLDLMSAVQRVGQKKFKRIATIAKTNEQHAIANWLKKRLGDFSCPACDENSWAVEYEG